MDEGKKIEGCGGGVKKRRVEKVEVCRRGERKEVGIRLIVVEFIEI